MEPFSADNHAPDAPAFHPVGPDELGRVEPLLAASYPFLLEGGAPLEVIGDVNINSSNFRMGSYFLKVIDDPGPRDYVPSFPAIAAALAEHGIPSGRFVENVDGDLLTVVTGPGGELSQYVYVQEYLGAGFYTGRSDEFEICVDLIERLGPAVSSIRPTPGQQEPYLSWRPLDVLAGIDDAIAGAAQDGDSGRSWTERFAVARPEVRLLAQSYEAVRNDLAGARLAHHDLHPHNLLFQDGQLAAVLDLESFRVLPPQMAEAFSLFKLGRKSVSLGRMTIDEFRQIASGRFDLSELRGFAKFEVMRRVLFLFEQRFLHGSDRWGPEIDKQLAGLDEVDLLFG